MVEQGLMLKIAFLCVLSDILMTHLTFAFNPSLIEYEGNLIVKFLYENRLYSLLISQVLSYFSFVLGYIKFLYWVYNKLKLYQSRFAYFNSFLITLTIIYIAITPFIVGTSSWICTYLILLFK